MLKHAGSLADRDLLNSVRLYTPNFVLHDWRGDDASGMDGLVKGVADEHATFLDLSESPEEIVAESDLVVDRFITKARQARDLDPIPHHSPGVPNRGKPLRMPEMEMFRVVDGNVSILLNTCIFAGPDVAILHSNIAATVSWPQPAF